MKILIKDSIGRDVMNICNGRVAIGRLDGLSKIELENLYGIYKNITGDDSSYIKDFLSFQTEEDEFCS